MVEYFVPLNPAKLIDEQEKIGNAFSGLGKALPGMPIRVGRPDYLHPFFCQLELGCPAVTLDEPNSRPPGFYHGASFTQTPLWLWFYSGEK